MSRDPIKVSIERRLYAESMGRCMNPNCQKELLSKRGDILEKAHIVPYCETADNDFENLVILCPNCHTEFDKNNAFSYEEVRRWKRIRRQEIESFFGVHFRSFDELENRVVPFLLENRNIFDQYYLGDQKELWDRFEPVILMNNRKLKTILLNNQHLFQNYSNKSFSNLDCIMKFIRHIDEFEVTRSDQEKIRKILFPSEIYSLFGITPVHNMWLQSTESLEKCIEELIAQKKFSTVVLGVENPYLETVESGKVKRIYLDDLPRIRQQCHINRSFRRTKVRLESLNFALKYIHSRGIVYTIPYFTNLRTIQIKNTKIIFVYEYCLSKAEIIHISPDEGEIIVNLHNWNGESCISKEAYALAAEWGVILLRMDEFYGFINRFKK